jgi:hypothetical protein
MEQRPGEDALVPDKFWLDWIFRSIYNHHGCVTRKAMQRLEKRPTFPVAGIEEPTRLSLLPEDMDVQIERVLAYLKEKLTELERFMYLIRLCDRNEALFYKVLTSDPMRFLLASDTRRNLHEIWLHSRPSARDVRFDPLQWSSREIAVELAV